MVYRLLIPSVGSLFSLPGRCPFSSEWCKEKLPGIVDDKNLGVKGIKQFEIVRTGKGAAKRQH